MQKTILRHACSLCLCLSLSVGLSAQAAAAEPVQISIDIGHAQLTATQWQDAAGFNETVLALPGSGGDASRYKTIGPLIADAGYRVIAINQRGIMGSTGDLTGLTLHDYAADIAKIIDSLGLEKIHMVP